jgi:peptidoglycan/LPS O-acetylase OafA/YrhL
VTELLAPTREQAPDVVKPPPGNPRFPLFDSLRGLAALAIVLTHVGLGSGANYNAVYGALLARLDIGVTLFFVLSGFLLYRPFVAARLEARPAPRLRDYARRRVLRIVPAYWLALTVLAIWPGLTFTAPRWAYYGFVQNYDFLWVLGGIGQAWSLAVEASFYVLLPFYAIALGALTRRFAPRRTFTVEVTVLALLSGASIALRWYIHHTTNSQVLLFTILCTFFWFALGMGLAVASAAWHGREHKPAVVGLVERAPSLWWVAALGLFAVMSWGYGLPRGLAGTPSGLQYLGEHLTYGAVSLLLVVPAVWGDRLGGLPRRFLRLRVMAWLGLVSYGLFLWHGRWTQFFIEEGAGEWLPQVGSAFLVMLTLVLAVSLACASASYYLVERPILRYKDGFRRRRPDSAPEPPPAPAERQPAGRAV